MKYHDMQLHAKTASERQRLSKNFYMRLLKKKIIKTNIKIDTF